VLIILFSGDVLFTLENVWSNYASQNDRIGTTDEGDREKGDIVSDITSTFVVLIGIFFPSVTG